MRTSAEALPLKKIKALAATWEAEKTTSNIRTTSERLLLLIIRS